MKKLIVVLLLVIISFNGISQIVRYTAFQSKIETKKDDYYKKDWKEVSYLAVFDLDKEVIKVYDDKMISDIVLVRTLDVKTYPSGDKMTTFGAVDSDGLECTVGYIAFADQTGQHTATLIIMYSNLTLTYRLKKF